MYIVCPFESLISYVIVFMCNCVFWDPGDIHSPVHFSQMPTELAWQIPIVCIQCWDTPDDYKNISRCMVLWMSKS